MSNITRFGVSIDSKLLLEFDQLCDQKGYENRSEAIRDLIRKSIVEREWVYQSGVTAATLTLVYDHHKSDLTQKLTQVQHDSHHLIIATLHTHLDHNNCLEVLVLKGDSQEIKTLSDRLVAIKGVFWGQLSLATTAQKIK